MYEWLHVCMRVFTCAHVWRPEAESDVFFGCFRFIYRGRVSCLLLLNTCFPTVVPFLVCVMCLCSHSHKASRKPKIQVQTHEGELGYQEGSQMQTDSPPEAQKE